MAEVPDSQFYQPIFSPWLGYGEFAEFHSVGKSHTLVSPDRCWVLYSLIRQAIFLDGDIWECGVYKGGTAAMMANFLHKRAPYKRLHLFDTFDGMPETDPNYDIHRKGDFRDTSLDRVKSFVNYSEVTVFHQGLIPDTFAGLKHTRIALAHIDVDIWKSVIDCCEFVFPRLSVGGFIIFDDYGFPSCPGARTAVDTFFRGRETVPLVLPTGQAIVFKSH